MMHSKDDEGVLTAIKSYLVGRHKIIPAAVHIDGFLSIPVERPLMWRWHGAYVHEDDLRSKAWVHRPDIAIIGGADPGLRIIEHDGSAHDTLPGRRKTERRDAHYKEAGIPFLVLNAADLAQLGEDWRPEVDRFMEGSA